MRKEPADTSVLNDFRPRQGIIFRIGLPGSVTAGRDVWDPPVSDGRENSPNGPGDASLEAAFRHFAPEFERLVNQRIPPQFRAAFSAADIVQDVFTYALQHASCFRPISPAATRQWLQTLAGFKISDAIKSKLSQRRSRDLRVDYGEDSKGSMVPNINFAVAPGPRPSRIAVLGEAEAAVREAISQLPMQYQVAITMRYIEERPVAEIVKALDLPSDSAARSLIANGIRKLRAKLGRPGKYLSGAFDLIRQNHEVPSP